MAALFTEYDLLLNVFLCCNKVADGDPPVGGVAIELDADESGELPLPSLSSSKPIDLKVRAISSPCCNNCSVEGEVGSAVDGLQAAYVAGTGNVREPERCLLALLFVTMGKAAGGICGGGGGGGWSIYITEGMVPARARLKGRSGVRVSKLLVSIGNNLLFEYGVFNMLSR